MRAREAVAALSAAVMLSGCLATVGTEITVLPPTSDGNVPVAVRAMVSFDEVASSAFTSSDVDSIVSAMESRSGSAASVTREGGGILISTDLGYSSLVSSSGLTGVADARLELPGEGAAVVVITLTDPVDLREILLEAASRQPDGSALAAAMQSSTKMSVSVSFPGGVTAVVAPPGTVPSLAEGSVSVTQVLADFKDGDITVSGSLAQRSSSRFSMGLLAAAAVVFVFSMFWLRRR